MRVILLFFGLLWQFQLAGQYICFSDSTTVYELAGSDVNSIRGEASFYYGPYKVIVGGKFLDPEAKDSVGFYNCDVIIVDYKANKKYVLPLSYFPPFVAEQFSGVDYCYTVDQDTAYIMGGYGYDLAEGFETTFQTMTVFPIKTLIDSVLQRKDFSSLFEVVGDDRRLALKSGRLLRDQTFLVYGGQDLTAIKEEHTDGVTISEWNFEGQLRKFTLKKTQGYREIAEFQICNTSKVFYQCMPGMQYESVKKTTRQ
jgi:hypothetical protein